MDRKKRSRTRIRILKRAADLFAARGVESVTLEQIAAATQLTRTAIYYYYPSKEAILSALWKYGWRCLWNAVKPLEAKIKEDPMETLIQALQAEDALFRRKTSLMRCLSQMGGLGREFPIKEYARTCEARQRYLEFHRLLIEEGSRLGIFRIVDVQTAMRAIHGMIMGLLTASVGDKAIEREVLIEIIRRFLSG